MVCCQLTECFQLPKKPSIFRGLCMFICNLYWYYKVCIAAPRPVTRASLLLWRMPSRGQHPAWEIDHILSITRLDTTWSLRPVSGKRIYMSHVFFMAISVGLLAGSIAGRSATNDPRSACGSAHHGFRVKPEHLTFLCQKLRQWSGLHWNPLQADHSQTQRKDDAR